MVDYTLIRSKRKTIAIYITDNAAVQVRAPLNAPKSQIDAFVLSKRVWIDKNLLICKQSYQKKAEFTLKYGGLISFKGQNYPITAKDGQYAGFDGESFYLPSGLEPDNIKNNIIKIYIMLAKKLLTEKVSLYATCMGVKPTAVKVNGAKKRWGSCSGKNSINFSWMLIMADDEVIDYVVVHELSHIKEHNHSAKFWGIVAGVLPDYKKRQLRLKELQKKLECEAWM